MSVCSTRSCARAYKMPLVTAALALSSTLMLVAAAGDVDQTFGALGQVKTHFYSGFDAASAVAVQGDGKIVAAGFADDANFVPRLAVARYDANGTLPHETLMTSIELYGTKVLPLVRDQLD